MRKSLEVWITALLFIGISLSYLGSISQRSYWKKRCFEIQDNYEAISMENEELKDSIKVLNYKLSPIINKPRMYEKTY